jgi:glyoxylase-like metal-dependent hydrolase (beta-lactamase superfamily II)
MLTQVAPGVMVHHSELLANNTVVVRGPTGVLVVDPGITGTEMACLAADLRELGQPVVAGFATHPDWDHVLWHDELGDAPRYGTARCAQCMGDLRADPAWRTRVTGAFPEEVADDIPVEPFGLITPLPTGATTVPWDGPAVRVVEHPAHAVGHAALVVVDSGVLVAGDLLSDVFVPMLDEQRGDNDPVADHLRGLDALAAVAGDVAVVVPGHGSAGRGGEVRRRIGADRAYVHTLRDGGTFDDPRVTSPAPGWEWTTMIHDSQVARFGAGQD